jgi:hypothetical protein
MISKMQKNLKVKLLKVVVTLKTGLELIISEY